MTTERQYKMNVPSGGVLYIRVDERGAWYVELKGAAKWFPVQRHEDPIWISNRKWDGIPETLEIAPEVWKEVRQGVQVQDGLKTVPPSWEDKEGITEEIRTKAIDILKNGNPIEYFLNVYNKIHVGDRDLGNIMLYCTGAQHNKTSRGLHPKLTGESGMGKSDAVETYIHLLPNCAYIKTSLSSKALFYHDIKPGTLIFLDDYKQNDDLDVIIKQTSSKFHAPYEHRTIDKDREAQIMTAPPEIVWAITSVDSSQDLQVLNRQVGLDVDGSENQTKAVVEHLIEGSGKVEEQFPITEEVLICRAMVLELKKHNFFVVIPYWKRIKWNDYSSRRNPSIFLDMVRSNAVWFFMQREREDNIIQASEEDFLSARKIYVGRADSLIDKLSKAERKLAELILANGGELYRDDAARQMLVSVNRISQLVHGEKGKTGLIQKVPGFSAERATIKNETRNISKCLLSLNGYERFDGYDKIVSLEPVEECKDGVNRKLTEKTDKPYYTVSSVSNIDIIYGEVLQLLRDRNFKSLSFMKGKNGLFPYTLPRHSENGASRVASCKLTSEIEQAMIKKMEADRIREDQFKTPTKCQECGQMTPTIYTLNEGEGDFEMRFCKECYDNYLDDISSR